MVRSGWAGWLLTRRQSILTMASMNAGAYGPLQEGELERAREWGRTLAHHLGS